MLNKTTSIFVIGGLLNALCLGYVLFGLNERTSLERETEKLSTSISRFEKQLPDPSNTMALSHQIRTLNDRNREMKQAMRYDFGDVLPREQPDSPRVEVGDQRSYARDEINDLYTSRGRSVPDDDALGLPNQPDENRYRDQLRQINVARHIHQLLLDKDVEAISGIKRNSISPDHRIVETLNNLDDNALLTPPLTISFNATLENSLSVLHALQTPSSYLQILSLDMNTGNGETASGSDDLLLKVECTVAPIYSGQPVEQAETTETDTTDPSSEGDDENDGGSSFFE